MGPRLAVRIELPDALRALPVPALLLQPLVENAIRHGLEPKVERWPHRGQRASRSRRRWCCDVRDTGVGLRHDSADDGSRFGLRQVRERLAALYGERASLTLQAAPGERRRHAGQRAPAHARHAR